MQKVLLSLTLIISTPFLFGQTLFTYGNKNVSKQEFLSAFNKNPTPTAERKKALTEYLDLYIHYKLKVQAAKDNELQNQVNFNEESKNFKRQIAENILNEEAGIKPLIAEAFERSKKDIKVSQILVEFASNTDTAKAFASIQAAYKELQKGVSFEDVATKYTTDNTAKANKGSLGFITVFTLDYNFENQIYGLAKGNFSKPFKSQFGYHIFKNNDERLALGKRKIAQILIATPANILDVQRIPYKNLADSIVGLNSNGESFSKLAALYSNDNATAINGGLLAKEIGVGEYDTNFEEQIFALKNIGDISKPFATNFGYHIIQLVEKTPVAINLDDALANANLKQLVEKNERLSLSQKAVLPKWKALIKYRTLPYSTPTLYQFADSSLRGKPTENIKAINDTTKIFAIDKKTFQVGEFVNFLRSNLKQSKIDYALALQEFVNEQCINYYQTNLEKYNTNMQQQTKEFNEANLLFAAMDKYVWGKAGEDIVGLKAQYEKNKTKYQWGVGVSAIVVTSNNLKLAQELQEKIKAQPENYKAITSLYGSTVNADSNRYEMAQLPINATIENKVGYLSVIEKSGGENLYTFLYVTKVHGNKEQRQFDEARGMVINDYQQVLEAQWLVALKNKYPVKVNNLVWATIK